MSQVLTVAPYDFEEIIKNLVTENDEPVGSLYSGVQQRLLVDPLQNNWMPPPDEDGTTPRPFLVNSNVAVYYKIHSQPLLVPDMFLSLDVAVGPEWSKCSTHPYFVWEFGKVPDVVVEIVSNKVGHELDSKLHDYATIWVHYYVVYDLWHLLGDRDLYVFELTVTDFGRRYCLREGYRLPGVGLSLTVWQGAYEGINARWLRWCNADGNLIPSGYESTQREAARAEQEASRAARLAAKLRELGLDPDSI